jgi:hypothetical protein
LSLVESGKEPSYFREMSQAEKDEQHKTTLSKAWARLKGKKK